jgi:hypothetical protein
MLAMERVDFKISLTNIGFKLISFEILIEAIEKHKV